MAEIEKRPDGSYRVRWRERATRRRESQGGFATAKAAEAYARAVDDRLAAHLPGRPLPAEAVPTLEDGMIAWIEYLTPLRAPETVRRQKFSLAMFADFVNDTAATVSILSRDLLHGFYSWLRDPKTSRWGKEPRSLDTCARRVESAEQLWSWLADSDRFGPYVTHPKKITDQLPSDAGTEAQSPTWAEMDACAACAFGWYAWLAVVMRFTGLRISQVLRLRVRDIDLASGWLNFRGELGKSREERRGRRFPLSWHFLRLVWLQLERGYLAPDGPLVPTGESKQRRADPKRMRAAWERAGVDPAKWALPDHSFRAGFLGEMETARAPHQACKYLVGHSRGIDEHYVGGQALPLIDAVATIPPLALDTEAAVLAIPVRTNRRGEGVAP